MGNCYLIVLDGVGVGAQEDAWEYGDIGSNTLGHVVQQMKPHLPNLTKLGLGNIIPLDTVPPVREPLAAFGKAREISKGKDSTTGHWEIAGVVLEQAFPTYPAGFPVEVVNAFCKAIGKSRILANAPYSGTDVIDKFGEEHMKTGDPIVYTSADSVFQIACHEEVTSLETLYQWCEMARNKVMVGDHLVGRVIARPFTGKPGAFERLSDKRKDFSAQPPAHALPQRLQEFGVKTHSVGKVIDLFDGIGFTHYRKTKNNAEGIAQLLNVMSAVSDSFVFVNLIDFDQLFGHRLDPKGFAECLEEFDRAVPALIGKLKEDDILIITADHGNDPCTNSTDHAREFIPILAYPHKRFTSVDLGTRASFADIAATIATYFGMPHTYKATSFLS